MSDQSELECVSCETAFDPAPTGGFCPDCDTPHPEFGHEGVDDATDGEAEAAVDGDEADAASEADADPSAPPETDTVDSAGEADADESVGEAKAEATGDPGGDSGDAAEDGDADDGEPSTDVSAEDVPTHCPECGARILGDSGTDSEASQTDAATTPGELSACPSCGRSVTDESFCPDCGTDLDEHREAVSGTEEEPTAETDEPAEDRPVPTGETISLVVNGTGYEVADGDTFGRDDEDWLDDLVVAAGGSEEVSYISGEHLEFSFEDDGVYVTDVSRNGTMHNGTDLDGGRARVEDGDYLTLARRAEVKIEF